MPTLITAAEFRERFDIAKEIDARRIDPHIGSASRRLRRWVGSTLYDQAADVANNDTSDQDMVSDLKNAEAHLAFHYAILGFNSPLSGKGIVATAASAEGKEMRKYLLPTETAELAQQFLDLALEIAAPYMPAEDASAGFASVVDEEDAEASTRSFSGGSSC